MNWNKVQNILIISFLILNLILWYGNNIFISGNKISLERKEELIKTLEEINIEIVNFDDLNTKPMQLLEVVEPEYDENILIKNIFGDSSGVTQKVNNEGIIYEKDDEEIKIIIEGENKGKVIYTNNTKVTNDIIISELEAISMANEFIKKIFKDKSDWEKTSISGENSNYNIRFNEQIDGYNINSSYIDFEIENSIIKKVEIKRIKPSNFIGEKYEVMLIDDVIYSLLDNLKIEQDLSDEDIKITHISLGYDKNERILSNDIEKVSPHYIINLSNGVCYYVNAIYVLDYKKVVDIHYLEK